MFGKRFLFFGVLCFHVASLAYMSATDAPTETEIPHLPAGISHWKTGSYYCFRQNPPLIRMLAAAPVMFMPHQDVDAIRSGDPHARPELGMGSEFLEKNGDSVQMLYTVARITCIPFSLIGALVCFQWSRELFGVNAGLSAMALWCFSPMLLGHGHLLNPDVGSASTGLLATYLFWRWLKEPSSEKAILVGGGLALALASKLTLGLLVFLYPLLFALSCLRNQKLRDGYGVGRSSLQLASAISLGIFLLNGFYEFEGTGKSLGSYQFASQALGGEVSSKNPSFGNRFVGTCLENIPVPLPEYYVAGIDIQKADFERPWSSYLRGEWKEGGWWYYYTYAILVKTPVGFLLLMALAAFAYLTGIRASPTDEQVLFVVPMAMFLLCSSQSNMGVHYRYVIPSLPFAFIWASRVIGHTQTDRFQHQKVFVRLGLSSIALGVMSSLYVFPSSISFFNFAAGGPSRGPDHLLGSSVDWGQDATRLATWVANNRPTETVNLALASYVEPANLGFSGRVIEERPPGSRQFGPQDLRPGLYAISVNHLNGRNPTFGIFKRLQPIAQVGYTIKLFDISPEQLEETRRHAGKLAGQADIVNRLPLDSTIRVGFLACEAEDSIKGEQLLEFLNGDPWLTARVLTPEEIKLNQLDNIDAVLVPGGSATKKRMALGLDGIEHLREFTRKGGGYVGICGGSFLAMRGYGLNLVDATPLGGTTTDHEGNQFKLSNRGIGVVDVNLSTAGQKMFCSSAASLRMPYTSGPIVSLRHRDKKKIDVLARFSSETFLHKSQIGEMTGTPAIISTKFESGSVVLFSPHPDFGPSMNILVRDAAIFAGAQMRIQK